MSNKKETVTITKERYDNLCSIEEHMDVLDSLGVDNWSGYVGPTAYCDTCHTEKTWGEVDYCPLDGTKCHECGAAGK